MSLSARRAWIEIGVMTFGPGEVFVALRKESVDRNIILPKQLDRPAPVALRKESVDRNNGDNGKIKQSNKSLSARRAWIEIYNLSEIDDKFGGSLSARRAWIEIRV